MTPANQLAQTPARSWHGHPLWLVGFRPLFLLACAAGVAMPPIWALLYAGLLSPPPGLAPIQWHAHEMFFGFGFAVLGGFLLTATKNWVQVRGHFGRTLQFLSAAWLLERAVSWWGARWPPWLRLPLLNLYLVAVVVLVWWTLVRHRKTDSQQGNFLFLLALPIFIVARTLLLDADHFGEGRDLTLALFRLMFLVMLERTMPQFMKAAHQRTVPRVAALDWAIKGLGVLLVAAPLLPATVRTVASALLAALVVGRLATWSPHLGLRSVEVGVMFAGSLAVAVQLVLSVLEATWVGTLQVHVFTFGVMGLIIPAMLLRIAKGHTGRPVAFERIDRLALWLMIGALLARLIAPQLAPALYPQWVWLAAVGWSACFGVVAVRIAPMVLAERIDGKEH